MRQTHHQALTVRCEITGKEISANDAVPIDLIRDSIVATIKQAHPNLDPAGYISREELDRARMKYTQDVAQQDVDELVTLRAEVAKSLLNSELITQNLDKEFDAKATKGEKIADKVAAVAGSWNFIILFGVILFAWMGVNTAVILSKPFDPFPYIFLNLVLSCLAAIQAPVIMMSQNRQEARDRLRSEGDYKTNLKAELEIQHINEKIDKLINDQWKHLLEIQQMQMEMIEEISKRSKI